MSDHAHKDITDEQNQEEKRRPNTLNTKPPGMQNQRRLN